MPDSLEIVKFIASFAIIVIILYAFYYYAHNFTTKLSPQGKHIHIIESRIIGKNRFLLLIEVKDKILLLASDERGIELLYEWESQKSS